MEGLSKHERARYRIRVAEPEANPPNETSTTVPDTSRHGNPFTPEVIKAVLCACVGAFLFGYHLGVVNGPLDAIALDLGFAHDAYRQGSVVSSLLAGATVGSLTGGTLADMFGRKRALLVDSAFLFLGAFISYAAASLNQILAGRLITGLAIGISSAIVPLYISEVSPTSVRGALGSVNQLAICLGILGALCVNVVIPASSWRIMFLIAVVPSVVLALGMGISAESPRWLSSKGLHTTAEEVMIKLWGEKDESIEKMVPTKSNAKIPEIQRTDTLFSGRNLSVLIISCVLFLFQQFSGINAIVYFSTKVFAEAGTSNQNLASAAVGATNVFGTIIASFLMDHAGRKTLLSLSFMGMALSMGVMVLGFSLPSLASLSGTIALMGTLAYILAFGVGAGPVPGLLVPELASAEFRGQAMSFAYTTHWTINFLIGQLFLPAVHQFGISTVYCFFSVACFCAVFFVHNFIVETKGRSLEEIEKAMSV